MYTICYQTIFPAQIRKKTGGTMNMSTGSIGKQIRSIVMPHKVKISTSLITFNHLSILVIFLLPKNVKSPQAFTCHLFPLCVPKSK